MRIGNMAIAQHALSCMVIPHRLMCCNSTLASSCVCSQSCKYPGLFSRLKHISQSTHYSSPMEGIIPCWFNCPDRSSEFGTYWHCVLWIQIGTHARIHSMCTGIRTSSSPASIRLKISRLLDLEAEGRYQGGKRCHWPREEEEGGKDMTEEGERGGAMQWLYWI
jgi:hypothetical protein